MSDLSRGTEPLAPAMSPSPRSLTRGFQEAVDQVQGRFVEPRGHIVRAGGDRGSHPELGRFADLPVGFDDGERPDLAAVDGEFE